MPEVIKLNQKKKTAAEIRAGLPMPLRILTSPKTTLALGAVLGTLLTGGALAPAATGAALRSAPAVLGRGAAKAAKFLVPKSAKGALAALVGVPTAVGVLSSSKKARDIVKHALDPRESIKRGKKIGQIIEDPKNAEDILGIKKGQTVKEKIIAGAKAAGKVGAVVGGALAIGAAVKKGKEILAERKAAKAAKELIPQTKALGFTDPLPVGLGGIPVGKPVQVTPSGAPGATLKQPPIQNIIQIQLG